MAKIGAAFLAAGLLLALSITVPQSGRHLASQMSPPAQVTKRALLVGINKYRDPRIPTLSGAVNDVEDMKALLIGKFDFAPENIKVLRDEEATHAGIISALETHLVDKARPGDIVVFHYSGHGSQMKDVTGESPSGLDETLVPHDSRNPETRVFDISGSELKPLFRRLAEKTKNITVILDSCHSGTLVRAVRPVRMIPPDPRQPPPATRSVAGDRGLVGLSPNAQNKFSYALIAASSLKEVAFEHFADGKPRGALTYFFTRALRNAGAGVTYRDIMDGVMGNVTLNYPSQHPQLEGLQADQHVFGDTGSVAQTYVLASPMRDGRVSLDAGQVFGITAGSIFDVFAPGTKAFDGQPVARVEITEVMNFTAYAKLLSGKSIMNFSRAIEREHNYSGLQLLLYFDAAGDSAQLRSVRDAVSGYNHVQVVTDQNAAHLLVRRDADRLLTLGADETSYSPPLAFTDPEHIAKFTAQIDQWARWFNTLSIRNANPALQATLQITTRKDGKTRDPFARIESGGPTVMVDEAIEVTVINKSPKDLYFALLDLETDGSIDVIFPAAGAHEVLKAGTSFLKTFYTTLPPGKTEVVDVVKLLASVRQFDAEAIARPPVRDPAFPEDPVGKLLAFARGVSPLPPGPRPNAPSGAAASPASTGPIAVDQWVTDQKVIKVRAK